MSLLPGRIIPATQPFGRVNGDGTVTIDKTWWLFLYNLGLQVLGTGGGMPSDGLLELEEADTDAADSDALALRVPLASLATLMPTESDPAPSLQDVKNALLVAYVALDAADAAASLTRGSVTSVGLAPGSADITVGSPNPVTSTGMIPIDLSAAVKTALTAAGTALQPVTGLSGSYTYAALTLNASGQITAAASGTQPVTAIGSSNLTVGGSSALPTVNLSSAQVANIAAGGAALQSASVIDSLTGAGTAGSPLQLSGDAATPGNAYYYGTNGAGMKGWYASVAVPTSAAASASVGLAAVAGSGTAYMLANAAPALNQAIAPTWTGVHTFDAQPVINGAANANAIAINGSGTSGQSYGPFIKAGTNASDYAIRILNAGGSVQFFSITGAGATQLSGPLGVNNVTPPAQVTGWGTPTGAAVVANFNGASASLVNCSNAIAELITILKGVGLIGA